MVGSDQEARAQGGLRRTAADGGNRLAPSCMQMIDRDGAPVREDARIRMSIIGMSRWRARMLHRGWNWPKTGAGVKVGGCAT